MAKTIVPPDDDMIDSRDGVRLYQLDIEESTPLYRRFKLMADAPIHGPRKVGYLTWICHEGRLVRGSDHWTIQQVNPELIEWVCGLLATHYDREYVQETFGFTDEEYDTLVKVDKEGRDIKRAERKSRAE